MEKEILSNDELIKYHDILTKNKTMCRCGHSLIIPPHFKKIVCSWCGRYVFRNKKDEFEYRLQETMHREVENKNKK